MTIYTDVERLEAIIQHFGMNDQAFDVEEAVRDAAEFLRTLGKDAERYRKVRPICIIRRCTSHTYSVEGKALDHFLDKRPQPSES